MHPSVIRESAHGDADALSLPSPRGVSRFSPMLEPIRDALENTTQRDGAEIDKRWSQRLSKQVQSAEIDLLVNLGRAQLTFEQLLSMKVGDVIALDIPQPMTAEIDGVPVMECRCGIFNGQYALKVEQLLPAKTQEN